MAMCLTSLDAVHAIEDSLVAEVGRQLNSEERMRPVSSSPADGVAGTGVA